ncbi:MAG: ABC transporter ATP-binding protein [Thermodesulfobacteriota bacterium]
MVEVKTVILAALDLSFSYGRELVLDSVRLALGQGELAAIVGPNGSGKSTLLKILGGLLRPKRGEVRLWGKPVAEFSRLELARHLGYVPQTPELAPGFTVWETALAGRFPLLGRRFFENARDLAAAEKALASTHLTDLRNRAVAELSGGERQRLALSRALTAEPRILLLDEPTSALDLKHQLDFMRLLESACQREGLTVGLISHDLNLAALFCDRIFLLHQGRCLANGRPEEVLKPDVLEMAYGVPLIIDREPTRKRPRVTLAPPG